MSIEIRSVYKSFNTSDRQIDVLKDVNFSLEKGEIVAIVGQSGSGKSTLLSLIAGMERPDSGKIIIGDTAIENMTEEQITVWRGQKIGIVFQQFHLIDSLTALENVSLPHELSLGYADEEKAKKRLDEVGLTERLGHFPNQLSGGEKQRVAIARSLMLAPEILLADEPTGNLDAETSQRVIDIMFATIRKHRMTTLIVTHNPQLAQLCDRTLQLNFGKIETQ